MYMFTSRGLIPREVFSLLTDIPEDISDNRDESNIDTDDNFIPAAEETSSSSEDESQDRIAALWCGWSCHVSVSVFSNLRLLFVEGNRDPTTSGLQSYLEIDENDGVVLTANDGTKWKKIQVSVPSTGRLAGRNILRQCPGPTSYVRRNIQAGSPASAWHLLLRSLYLNTSGKAPSLKLHCRYVGEE